MNPRVRKVLRKLALPLFASIDYFTDRENDINKNFMLSTQVSNQSKQLQNMNLVLEITLDSLEKVKTASELSDQNTEMKLNRVEVENDSKISNLRHEIENKLVELNNQLNKEMKRQENELSKLLTMAEIETENKYKYALDFEIREQLHQLLKLLELNHVDGVGMQRFGVKLDGGYVLIDDLSRSDIVLSVGVGHDVSFDVAISELVRKVILIDGSLDRLPDHVPNSIFFSKYLSTQLGDDLVTLENLLAIENGQDFILKMDIEGAEWDILLDASLETLREFRQIIIEFHNMTSFENPHFVNIRKRVLEKLNTTHSPINIHANNFSQYCILGGIPMPDTLEVSWVRKGSYQLINGSTSELSLLNFPNRTDKPEYLTWWNYKYE